MKSTETFGAYLKRLRTARGWSQRDLALEAGWDSVTGTVMISAYERGVKTPTTKSAVDLLTVLGGSLDEVYGL